MATRSPAKTAILHINAGGAAPRKAPARRVDIEMLLRKRIANQQIAPGSKLLEKELSQEYGVSRTQVREAFASLALRGLIDRIPNRGAVVSRLEVDSAMEIFAVRAALEGMCARLAAQNSSKEDWLPFIELFDGPMKQHVRNSDFEAFLDIYGKFRQAMIHHAGNQTLTRMLDIIHEKVVTLSRRIIILPHRAEQALKEHRAVLDALLRGDADAAEDMRKANMRSGAEWFARYRNFVL